MAQKERGGAKKHQWQTGSCDRYTETWQDVVNSRVAQSRESRIVGNAVYGQCTLFSNFKTVGPFKFSRGTSNDVACNILPADLEFDTCALK